MQEAIHIIDQEWLWLLLVFLVGTTAYIISTVGAGGGALMTIPAISGILSTSITAPVVNLGAFLGRPSRLILYWKTIDWKIVWIYLPAAASGSLIAAWFFKSSPQQWLQIIIGLFLISTLLQYRFGKKRRTFTMKKWYFAPIGFIVSLVGTFTGGMGPVQNPFYLNLKLSKEEMIGTKSANSFFMGIFQFVGYASVGILTPRILIFGLVLGIGATVGNIIGKRILVKISDQLFLRFVLVIMVTSGFTLIIKASIPY